MEIGSLGLRLEEYLQGGYFFQHLESVADASLPAGDHQLNPQILFLQFPFPMTGGSEAHIRLFTPYVCFC